MVQHSMKGQTHFGPEIMITAVGFVLLAVILVVIIFQFQTYSITYESRPELRQLIDYSENFMSSTCLVFEDHGTFFKGIFDKSKLDKNPAGCINFPEPVSISIKDEIVGSWSISKGTGNQQLTYPIVVKYPDKLVPGTLEVAI